MNPEILVLAKVFVSLLRWRLYPALFAGSTAPLRGFPLWNIMTVRTNTACLSFQASRGRIFRASFCLDHSFSFNNLRDFFVVVGILASTLNHGFFEGEVVEIGPVFVHVILGGLLFFTFLRRFSFNLAPSSHRFLTHLPYLIECSHVQVREVTNEFLGT